MISIGGASCSGKSTLTNLLSHFLGAAIIHQDLFFKPDQEIPMSHGVANWDCPEALEEDEFIQVIKNAKSCADCFTGNARPSLNLNNVPNTRFLPLINSIKSKTQSIVLVDGFLLYYKQEIMDLMDLKFFLTAKQSTLKKRRKERGYNTSQGFYQDPPDYFDKVLWPCYLQYNANVLQNGQDVIMLDSDANTIEKMVYIALKAIDDYLS